MRIYKQKSTLLFLVLLFLLGPPGCSANVPTDFNMIVDARRSEPAAGSPTEHIYLEINQSGSSSYIIYDTGGTITHDSDGFISISPGQIIKTGSFKISSQALENIWNQLEDSHFFDLNDDYRMSIGNAYAFLVVRANSQTHSVDNIGIFLPEIQGIFQAINGSLPDQLLIEYSHLDPGFYE